MEKEISERERARLDAEFELLKKAFGTRVRQLKEREARELVEGKKEPPTQGDLFNSEES